MGTISKLTQNLSVAQRSAFIIIIERIVINTFYHIFTKDWIYEVFEILFPEKERLS